MEVSTDSLDIEPGESTTYSVRLSEKPSVNGVDVNDVNDEWFVLVFINGMKSPEGQYKDIHIVPGLYRPFNMNDWDTWKDFRVSRDSDDKWAEKLKEDPSLTRATSVTITHEVWDHTTNCPIHNVGVVTLGNGDGKRRERKYRK